MSDDDSDFQEYRKPGPKSRTKILIKKKRKATKKISSEEDMDAEPSMLLSSDSRDKSRRSKNAPKMDDELERLRHMPTADVNTEVLDHIQEVQTVAQNSGNLKGTYIRKLNCAAVTLTAAITTLTKRSGGSEDISWLKQHNAKLEQEVMQLKQDVKRLTAALTRQSGKSFTSNIGSAVQHNTAGGQHPNVEELPPVLRPPIQGQRKVITDTPHAFFSAQEREIDELITRRINDLLDQRQRLHDGNVGNLHSTTTTKPRMNKAKRPADLATNPERVTRGTDTAGNTTMTGDPTVTPADNIAEGLLTTEYPPLTPWTQVLGRKKQRRERIRREQSKTRSQPQQLNQRQRSATRTPRMPRRRQPKTAAVAISSRDNRKPYAEILREAKSKIDLKQLGIEDTRIRRAITGGIIIEISGDQHSQKADVLANTLRQAFTNADDVTISRPAKRAELRLSGLDDSITPEDVRIALADVGNCSSHDIKTGNVRITSRGLGTIWVQCPLSAALLIVAQERIRLGWTSVRATLLKQRPMQCFRCFERGHVKQHCTNPVDRSNRCYNYGSTAHQAKDCRYLMKCPICADLGLPARHKVGGEACHPPKRPNIPKPKPTPSDALNTQDIVVDVTQATLTSSQPTASALTDYTAAEAGGMAWEEANSTIPNNDQGTTI